MTKIEWAQSVWNPIAGCTIVSPGCTNCYAMKMAARLEAMGQPRYEGLTKKTKAGAVWTGKMRFVEEALLKPLKRKTPTTYFVNSMSDLFHEDVPDAWILRVLDVIRSTGYDGGSNCGRIRNERGGEGQHVYQVLTKRSWRMLDIMSRLAWDGERLYLRPTYEGKRVILRNLWLGVSAERQKEADERIPDLLATPAAVRFVSAEPLLGAIDFTNLSCEAHPQGFVNALRFNECRLDWIIVGGESGHGAREMKREWADDIVRQCKAAGVPVFVKQLGAAYSDEKNGVGGATIKVPSEVTLARRLRHRKGGDMAEWPEELRIREMPA